MSMLTQEVDRDLGQVASELEHVLRCLVAARPDPKDRKVSLMYFIREVVAQGALRIVGDKQVALQVDMPSSKQRIRGLVVESIPELPASFGRMRLCEIQVFDPLNPDVVVWLDFGVKLVMLVEFWQFDDVPRDERAAFDAHVPMLKDAFSA